MPHEIKHAGNMIEGRFFGRLDEDDLIQVAAEVGEIEMVAAPSPHRLLDLSAVDSVNFGFLQMEDLVRKRSAAKLRNPVKSAIVAPKDIQFGFARMFQQLMDHPQITISVFRDAPSARAWLRKGPA